LNQEQSAAIKKRTATSKWDSESDDGRVRSLRLHSRSEATESEPESPQLLGFRFHLYILVQNGKSLGGGLVQDIIKNMGLGRQPCSKSSTA
jgi:hypothetical protein